MSVISRPIYEKRIRAWRKSDVSRLLVVTGPTAVGKSTVLKKALEGEAGVICSGENELAENFLADLPDELPCAPLLLIDTGHELTERLAGRFYAFLSQRPAAKIIFVGEASRAVFSCRAIRDLGAEHLPVRPLIFEEYLAFMGRESLLQCLGDFVIQRSGSDAVKDLLLKEWYGFVAVGGMPGAVCAYREGENVEYVQRRYWRNILENEVRKARHSAPPDLMRSLLSVLAEGCPEKFQYVSVPGVSVRGGWRAAHVKKAADVLADRGYLTILPHAHMEAFERVENEKFMRCLWFDSGVQRAGSAGRVRLAQIPLDALQSRCFVDGVIAREIAVRTGGVYWWRRQETGAEAAVEFSFELPAGLVPVTLKSKDGRSQQSVRLMQAEEGVLRAVILSKTDFEEKGNAITVPVYTLGALIDAMQSNRIKI